MLSALLTLSLLSAGGARAEGYASAAYVDLASGGSRLLRAPAARDCLGAPDAEIAGEGFAMIGSRGLDVDAVKVAMASFNPNLFQCVSPESAPNGTLELSITVGCDGRVSEVEVISDDDLPAPLVRCVQELLELAPFPTHDLPDGESFLYPMRFAWPG
jgi:hypothetical protein